MIKEKKQDKKKSDSRIPDAIAVKELLSQSGFKVLEREWEKIKEQAFADFINEGLPESNLSQRQKIYNQITEWINLPASIMKKGEIAVEGQKAEKEREEHPIKEAKSFLGLRY